MGVEIEITPAGKATKRLTLLSGGEKSMTALAFLFAVFLARPCPFYILDEVEAALDDLNIDRFLTMLRGFADRAQFIVVTHQKRTMEAADCLYGVSMAGDGVSRVVSRRLPREDAAEAGGLVGLLVTFRPKDRRLAPPGKDADPKEYPGMSLLRGEAVARPQAETVQSPAVISVAEFGGTWGRPTSHGGARRSRTGRRRREGRAATRAGPRAPARAERRARRSGLGDAVER